MSEISTVPRLEMSLRNRAMSRIIALVLSCLVAGFVPSVAAAQTETVRYYHTDAIGSVRMITGEAGQVIQRYDYWPSGVPAERPTVPESRRFAGEERDAATQFGYFGARDYQSQTGRFTAADPITVNALRLVNPQRWNRYAYAVNNPLRYVDPDGLDALLVNYTDGAYGLGHIGIMALNPDGSGLYGGFNPVNGSFADFRGTVATLSVPAGFVQFGMDGRPTDASLTRLRQRLVVLDGKSAHAIRIRHIKTSGAETAALDAYIQRVDKNPPSYAMGVNDCLDFCVRGLWSAGIPAPPPSVVPGGASPDVYFRSLLLDRASWLAESWNRPTPKVETSYCIQGLNCR